MPDRRRVPDESGYVVTEAGSHDLRVAPTCSCNPRLAGLLIECPDCGTIYGSLRDSIGRGGYVEPKRQ